MSREMIEILILAAIAGFVVFRLYSVLGRRTGSERPQPRPVRSTPEAQAEPAPIPRAPAPSASAPSAAFDAPGLADVARADAAFDPAQFLNGARAAYEMIVQAFGKGDRETLQPLLTPKVFNAFEGAIAGRGDGVQGPELVRLKSATLVGGRVEGRLARVDVRFEAELAEGASGLRDARERWTFEREAGSPDPNWRLAAVAPA